jgi:hypothetical protein
MKIKIYLISILCLFGFVPMDSVLAAQILPAGGSGFETAVSLSPGQYQGELSQEYTYYSFQVKPGQEVTIGGTFPDDPKDEVEMFDENKGETLSFGPWLLGAQKNSYTYYLKLHSWSYPDETVPGSLDISLVDRFDVGMQTDAGNSFDKASAIIPGSYKGYLSGEAVFSVYGTDNVDTYKISVEKGVTYKFKLTPPSNESLDLGLYDLNRTEVQKESSANDGAMVTFSLTPVANTNVFLTIERGTYTNSRLIEYALDITSSAPLSKFYTCQNKSCGTAGEYTSLAECQNTTTKTCYKTATCDEACGITIALPLPRCDKNSDCFSGKICQSNRCVNKPDVPSVPPPLTKCVKDSECKTGLVCKDSKCQTPIVTAGCTKDTECPAKNICKNGKCEATSTLPDIPLKPDVPPSGQKNLNFMYAGIGVAIIVLLIVIIVILLRKKTK